MSKRSVQMTFWSMLDDQTPLSAASHASHGQAQESDLGQQTQDTSGQSTTGSSATCGHAGSWGRTCPVCCLAVLTSYSLTSQRQATPAGRSYWVLTPSERLTVDRGSSSSQEGGNWPTPQARDFNGPSGRAYKGQEVDLPTAVRIWGNGQQDRAIASIRGRHHGALNPAWVAQLMGFPADWQDGVKVPSRD